jgi:hypothetical protein
VLKQRLEADGKRQCCAYNDDLLDIDNDKMVNVMSVSNQLALPIISADYCADYSADYYSDYSAD